MAVLLVRAVPASAQLYESVGTRAQGMGGAFVAVADDASAAWWNPAGLASGAYFNVVVEKGEITQPADPAQFESASRTSTSGFAVAFPALGLSYYRQRVSDMAPVGTTEPDGAARQGVGGGTRLRSLALRTFGMTVGQSMGQHIVVGSTIKLVSAGASTSDVVAEDGTLDAADDLDVDTDTRLGLDMGVMATMGAVRLGASVRNVKRPKFGEGDDEFALARLARAGIAVRKGPVAVFDSLVVAADTDLTKTSTIFGEVRHTAAGGEAWLLHTRLGLRAGVTVNTTGERRPVWSTGVSVAPLKGVYIEGARTTGTDASLEGWTTTLRLTF